MPAQVSLSEQMQRVAIAMPRGELLDFATFWRRAVWLGCYDAADAVRDADQRGGRVGYLDLLDACGLDTRA